MKVNGIDISKMIEESRNYINKIPLDTNKGTKTMKKKFHEKQVALKNDFIVSEIKKYTKYKDTVLSSINRRIEKKMPISNDKEFEQQEKYINRLLKLSVLENNYSNNIFLYEIVKSIFELAQYGKDNIDDMNIKLKNIIDNFISVGIKINVNLFYYSDVTLKYMTEFLKKMNDNDFCKNMRNVFETLYFENPQIINHLKLNLIYIVSTYKKKIIGYNSNKLIENKRDLNIENLYSEYCIKSSELIFKINSDKLTILNKFLNNQLKVEDYLDCDEASNIFFSNLIDNTCFKELSKNEKNELYNQVLKLKSSIAELKEYFYFKPMISDLLKIYKNNTDISKKYNDKNKELETALKFRNKLFNNYMKVNKPNLFGKINQMKLNNATLLLNNKIEEILKLYDELNNLEINNLIFNNINDSSSIKDLLLQATYSYPYLKSIYDNIYNSSEENISFNDFENRLIKFIYNPNNTFINKCSITIENIPEVVAKKYKLFDLNINENDLEMDSIQKIELLVNSIVDLYYIIESKINMKDVKFIYEGKQI